MAGHFLPASWRGIIQARGGSSCCRRSRAQRRDGVTRRQRRQKIGLGEQVRIVGAGAHDDVHAGDSLVHGEFRRLVRRFVSGLGRVHRDVDTFHVLFQLELRAKLALQVRLQQPRRHHPGANVDPNLGAADGIAVQMSHTAGDRPHQEFLDEAQRSLRNGMRERSALRPGGGRVGKQNRCRKT